MSELQFPEDHHLAYPHVRLSKKKYLVFENDQLYLAKLKADQAIYTPIVHRSEIRKLEAQMFHSQNGNSLHINILPRMGKKKSYLVHAKKLSYKQPDWVQIDDFFLALDFQPNPAYPEKRLREAQTALSVGGLYLYFPAGDRVFELCENPMFKQELESKSLKFLPILFMILGFIGLIIAIVLGVIAYEDTSTPVWIISVASLACFGYSIPQIQKHIRNKKDFIQKYDLAYYFK
jgi:preprotein translocase subunit Sss1